MYTLTGSDSIPKQLNNLHFSSNFNYKPEITNVFSASNLSRYRSAPSSIFDVLLDEVKIDSDLSSDLKPQVADLDGSDFFNVPDMGYVIPGLPNADKSFRGLEEMNLVKKNSNLIRQSSSPAGYLSNLVAQIGNYFYLFICSVVFILLSMLFVNFNFIFVYICLVFCFIGLDCKKIEASRK